ncbi:MAG TPA: S8 family serine peptidase [Thermoanaerobaculia bacterium]|nr:S8 family serine peptidase [Thermoanaerobaculia bacterium]
MYILNARREKVQLARLDTEVMDDPATGRTTVAVATRRGRDPVNTSGLVARAARAFFEIGGQQSGKAAVAAPQVGPPPVAFRETASGLLHVVYRELVVRFAHATAEKRRRDILREGGFQIRRVNPFVPDQVVVYDPKRKHSGEDLVEVSNRWMGLDEVVFAAPNFVSQFLRQAVPSIRSEEWHLKNTGSSGAKSGEDVNVAAAWQKTTGDPGIVVAVLDDGVDVEHPNLAGNIWKNPDASSQDKVGRDFFVPADNPEHFNPRPKRFTFPFHLMAGNDIHGTPCAGVIAAAGKNGGSIGVAPRCRILPVKVFHADDLAPGESVANAIRYAAIHADILSCSWSGGINPDIEQALEDAGQLGRQGRGAAVFCAAGNENGSPVGFPARDPNAIAVGASTDQGNRASYSNIGPQIAFVAPSSGGIRGIFTTDVSLANRGFNVGTKEQGGEDGLHTNSFGGTSSATPLAAGVGALVLSVNPDLSRSDLRDLLARTADKIGSDHDAQGHSKQFGFGRINAGKAVAEAEALSAHG